MSFVCLVPVQLFLSSMAGLCHKNGYSSCKGPPDNGHLIHKTCHCQVLVEPRHQYWISAVAPQTSSCKTSVVAPRNVGCYLRLQGLLIRIYCGETLTILQLRAESHLVCLLREAWWKFESDSHPREKLTRTKRKLLSVVTLNLAHLEASWKFAIKLLLATLLLEIAAEKRMHNMYWSL